MRPHRGVRGLRASRASRVALPALALALACLVAGCPALPGGSGSGGLDAVWTSETQRNVTGNHHAVAAGRVDGVGVVFAPISGEDRSRHCALVALYAENGSQAWSAGIPPDDCIIHSVADPRLADFDDDGVREVLAATTQQAIVAHHPGTGAVEWRYELSSYGYTQAAVADLAPADGPEVVVADVRGGVFAVNPEAGTAWSADVGGHVWAQPAVRDLDADGRDELVVGHGGGGVVAFERDGAVAWRVSDAIPRSVTWLSVGQLDDDPAVEVVVASTGGRVLAIDGRAGEVTWTRDLGPFAAVHAIGDGDDDGDAEVYAAARDGTLRSLAGPDGAVEWVTTLTNESVQMAPPPSMGDVDDDGRPELVAATNDGLVSVVDPADGAVLATYHRPVTGPPDAAGEGVPIYTHPTLADTDGDGVPEIYVIYGDGRVAKLAYDGE